MSNKMKIKTEAEFFFSFSQNKFSISSELYNIKSVFVKINSIVNNLKISAYILLKTVMKFSQLKSNISR